MQLNEIRSGDIFNYLTFLSEVEPYRLPCGNKMRMAKFKCICGEIKQMCFWRVVRGESKSCGCMRKFTNVGCKHTTTHGQTKTVIYRRWAAIKSRCCNVNYRFYSTYGGRGIKMCEEWKNSFEVFRDWCLANGYKPNLQIDRIENDGDYTPQNCRFVTPEENCNNRRSNKKIEFKGEMLSLKDICRAEGLENRVNSVSMHLFRGNDIYTAIFKSKTIVRHHQIQKTV